LGWYNGARGRRFTDMAKPKSVWSILISRPKKKGGKKKPKGGGS
jgi:hypothetical protein